MAIKIKPPSRLEVIALLSGFAMMAFELVGARILAPTIGSSNYVWTNVLGVIIASLSIGYHVGGRLADRRKRPTDIAFICLATAISITFTLVAYSGITESIVSSVSDPRLQGLVASIFLFAPASFLLGIISPYLAKLSIKSIETSGRRIANLSALNAIGSILGTFLTGFVLFSLIGARHTLVVVIIILLFASWLVTPKAQLGVRLFITSVVLLVSVVSAVEYDSSNVFVDTAIATYEIQYQPHKNSPNATVNLITGPGGIQSGAILNDPGRLIFWYTEEIANAVAQIDKRDNILILGGGAFTLPSYLAKAYPESSVEVVEIDPGLEKIAVDHFRFSHLDNLHLFFEDARTFVNKATGKYDIIIVDVYSDAEIPWTFTTREYGEKIAGIIAHDGVILVNAIAAIEGKCQEILDVVSSPYSSYFSSRYVLPRSPEDLTRRSNLILAYSNRSLNMQSFIPLTTLGVKHFTDDFAPTDSAWQACVQG